MNAQTLAAASLLFALSGFGAAESGTVPMNPLNPIAVRGITNVFLLQNRQIEALLLPPIGRVIYLGFRGEENAVRFDEALAALPPRAETEDWRNYGGDWLWPVSQAHWPEHFGANWPPPYSIDGAPWRAHGWINDDQSQTVLMELEVGAPVHIRVQRTFTLAPDAARLEVRQRIERVAESRVPVTLWTISQIQQAERIAMAVEPSSPWVGGYRVLDFAPPPAELLHTAESDVLVVDVRQAPELKIGSDSPRGWIAAQRGNLLILEKAVGDPDAPAFPDGGCRTELYSNSGLGYSEIETLSEEAALLPGETIENVLSIVLARMEANADTTSFIARVRELLGESPAAPPAAE